MTGRTMSNPHVVAPGDVVAPVAPTALTGLAGLVGFVGGLGALSRKSFLVALGLIAVSGLGGLLAVAGFVLGA